MSDVSNNIKASPQFKLSCKHLIVIHFTSSKMVGISNEIHLLLTEIAKDEKFIKFQIKYNNGSEKGDGFLSDIINIQIIGEQMHQNGEMINNELNLVCKMAFPEASQREQFKSDKAFKREIIFYRDIAPAFLKFQIDRGLSAEQMFKAFPKCYKTVFDPERNIFAIILQDMRPNGFQMWPKEKINKIENTKMIISELAKLHAISFTMKDQCFDEFEKFEKLNDLWPEYFDNSGAFNKIYIQNYCRMIKILDKPEHKRIYKLLIENLHEYFLSCSDKSIPNKFRVLCHGDAWNNNILLKLNSVINIVLIFFTVNV